MPYSYTPQSFTTTSYVPITSVEKTLPTEIINVSDSLNKLTTKIRPITESVIISDALAAVTTKARILPTEEITVSDSLLRVTAKTRSLSDNVDISDAVAISTLTGNHVVKSLTDSVTISEEIAIAQTKERIISEIVNISEALQAFKNGEELVPPIPPAPPEVPNLIGTRERAIRFPRRAPRPIVIDEISNVAIAPLKLLSV